MKRIDKLEGHLVNKKYKQRTRRTGFSRTKTTVEGRWKNENIEKKQRKIPFYGLLLISIFFFVIALITSATILFFGLNKTVSPDKVSVVIQGSNIVETGSPVPLQVLISNDNPIDITFADIVIEYPEGSYDSDNAYQKLRSTRDALGKITQGETIRHRISPTIYGKTSEEKEIKIALEYRVGGSTSLFSKDLSHSLTIASSVVSLEVDNFDKLISGEENSFFVTARSNSTLPLRNVSIKAFYPFGFTPISSIPTSTSQDTTEWRFTSLSPGESKRIQIRGILSGATNEERVIRFQANLSPTIAGGEVVVAEEDARVIIESPAIASEIILDDSTDDIYIARVDDRINGVIKWENKSPWRIDNVKFIVSIDGNALNHESIRATKGYYNGLLNQLIWDESSDRNLRSIAPGDFGSLRFTFEGARGPLLGISNKEVNLSLQINGTRVDSLDTKEEIKNVAVKTIRFISDVITLHSLYHQEGILKGQGPIPPRVGEETVYVLSYVVQNRGNQIEKARVEIPLAPGVIWKDSFTPDTEKVLFDNTSNILSWDLGLIEGDGRNATREIQFQIGIIPNANDRGTTKPLADKASFIGDDTFTNRRLNTRFTDLDTGDLKGNNNNDGVVVE